MVLAWARSAAIGTVYVGQLYITAPRSRYCQPIKDNIGFLIGHLEIDALPLVLLCFQTLIKFIPLPPGPHK